jgi:hypothetical protein
VIGAGFVTSLLVKQPTHSLRWAASVNSGLEHRGSSHILRPCDAPKDSSRSRHRTAS